MRVCNKELCRRRRTGYTKTQAGLGCEPTGTTAPLPRAPGLSGLGSTVGWSRWSGLTRKFGIQLQANLRPRGLPFCPSVRTTGRREGGLFLLYSRSFPGGLQQSSFRLDQAGLDLFSSFRVTYATPQSLPCERAVYLLFCAKSRSPLGGPQAASCAKYASGLSSNAPRACLGAEGICRALVMGSCRRNTLIHFHSANQVG